MADESLYLWELPPETQAYILSKLDGRSVAVCKQVCRLWKDLITGLETSFHLWLRCSLKEIPPHSLVELTRCVQLSGGREGTPAELAADWNACLESQLPWRFWRDIYAKYSRSHCIMNWNENVTTFRFDSRHGDITCLHIQDNVIYSGHENGDVISWKNIERNMRYHVLYKHPRRVTCITGLDMVTTVQDVHDGRCSNKIVSSSRDGSIILYNVKTRKKERIQHYSKQVNCVRSWGNHFIAAANRSLLQGQPIWTSTDQSKADVNITCTLFSQSATDITAVAFWKDEVISGDERGNLFHWTSCLGCGQRDQQDMTHVANIGSCIKSIYILGRRIVCFTNDGMLHVSHPADRFGFSRYDIHRAVLNFPECIAISGAILGIGFRSGLVYLYHLPREDSWNILDLTQPSRTIHTHQDHINALVFGDDGNAPFVAIATEECSLMIGKFCRSNNCKTIACGQPVSLCMICSLTCQ